jgi:hypothetical protein
MAAKAKYAGLRGDMVLLPLGETVAETMRYWASLPCQR